MAGASPGGILPASNKPPREQERAMSKEQALRLVAKALDQVEYGEIIVKMQGGKPVWVDKYERARLG